MTQLARGLYESLLTKALQEQLANLDSGHAAELEDLRAAEAGDRIALHLGRLLRRALESLPEKERAAHGVTLARELIAAIREAVPNAGVESEQPEIAAQVLHAIAAKLPDGTPEVVERPLIPLLDTTLLTNAPGEPRVGHQIHAEVRSANRIDVIMAFIRLSGIRPLLGVLKEHTQAGRPLRVLTTTYTGSTQAEALDRLIESGAEVRVSYDLSTTRLHAKAWLFHRGSGFSTAYVGSSNLTHSALASGLEWNVRVSGARNPDVIDKIGAVFGGYWSSGDFEPYDADEFRRRTETSAPKGPQVYLSPVEIRLEPFQARLLEQIAVARAHGKHRNLLVSATGTGKTVMAALDYAGLRNELPRSRLLFVAHRKEILDQSLATFRHALRDPAFGELWVGGDRPKLFEHVFASIQSLKAAGTAHLDPRHFDVVIVDEFHHAAAKTYRALLEHVEPVELLALTATPERADGLTILDWFGGRIAAELRLWDAIDQRRLCPFLYYGIHDGLDLRKVPWKRGSGYDVKALSNTYTASSSWANTVLDQLLQHAEDPQGMRVLGFCVSVAHARFMAAAFERKGLRAVAVSAETPKEDRRQALEDLAQQRIQVIFSVDLFNEGVDVPAVDTLLLLRPTDSGTLFLQQLGRGLRKATHKAACTVLDFVGQHRKEFRFDRKLRALLGGSRKNLINQVQGGFPFLPAGCHMELDPVASKIVLDNVRNAVPSGWAQKAAELRQLAQASPAGDMTLAEFLEESGLELEDVYRGSHGWSSLREDAGLSTGPVGEKEEVLRRAVSRLLHIDDEVRIETYRALLSEPAPPDASVLSEHERRLLRMLVASVCGQALPKGSKLQAGAEILWRHPQVRADLRALLDVLSDRVEHIQAPLEHMPEVPLRVHANYTRIEILASLTREDSARIAPWQTGVRWLEEASTDVFAFTLDKTTGGFSPTTRYRDYAINRELIHWESQSVTREDSATGKRYQGHQELGSHVLLFARLRTSDRAFWFLGPGTYVRHEGERPMAVTWKLRHPLPGDLYARFAAAVA